MSDALYDLLGINETETIDPTEVKAIKRLLVSIKAKSAEIARIHNSTDTVAMLSALLVMVGEFCKMVSPQEARRILNRHSNGENFEFGTTDPEIIRKLAAYDDVKRQLDNLQNMSNGLIPKNAGAGSADTKMEKLRQLADMNPDAADFAIQTIEALSRLPEDQQVERSVLAGRVVYGTHGYQIVSDPNGSGRIPKVLSDSRSRIKQLENDLAPTVNGSIGWKAAAHDLDMDESNPASLTARLKAAMAAKQNAEEKLAHAESQAHDLQKHVEKAKVQDKLNAVQTALNEISFPMGIKPKGVDKATSALDEAIALVQ